MPNESNIIQVLLAMKQFILISLLVTFCIQDTLAISKIKKHIPRRPIETSLVIDAKTGKILHEHNSRTLIYPASLTKLMTLYLLFDAVERGQVKMQSKLLVSCNAERMLPSKLGLRAGQHITVYDAILALIVKSANDVAVVVAENLNGSQNKFAQLMRSTAKELGMNDSYFVNASGWHDPTHKTTARDMAKLAIAIKRDFPKYYPLFSKTSFVFKGKIIAGHNTITKNYDGAEGLKTGYTIPAGWNVVTTASRGDKSLVAVVTGGVSARSRDQKMYLLLNKHFDNKTPDSAQKRDFKSKNIKLKRVHKAKKMAFLL